MTGDVTVRYLGFATQNLTPSYAHYRGHGFQLRCLSEETGEWCNYFGNDSCGSQSRAGRSHPRRRPATSRCSFPATLAPTLKSTFPIHRSHSARFVLGAQPSLRKCNCLRGLKPAEPKTSLASCGPPRAEASARATRWAANALPFSVGFILGRSQRRTNIKAEAASKRRCASPPHPGAAGRPLPRGLSYSLSAQSSTKSTAQSTASCSAQRGGKTGYGFPARRTARPKARPSSLPRIRLTAAPLSLRHIPVARSLKLGFFVQGRVCSRACAIHLYSATAEIVESLLLAAARGRALSRLKLPCAGGVRVIPAGRSDTAYRLISSAQFFNARPPKLRSGRAGPTSRGREMLAHFNWQPRPIAPYRIRKEKRPMFFSAIPVPRATARNGSSETWNGIRVF